MEAEQNSLSPCTGLCRIDHGLGFCRGCARTAEEIENWQFMSLKEKKEVLEKIIKRKETK